MTYLVYLYALIRPMIVVVTLFGIGCVFLLAFLNNRFPISLAANLDGRQVRRDYCGHYRVALFFDTHSAPGWYPRLLQSACLTAASHWLFASPLIGKFAPHRCDQILCGRTPRIRRVPWSSSATIQ